MIERIRSLQAQAAPLDPGQRDRLAARAVAFAADFLADLPQAPAYVKRLVEGLRRDGRNFVSSTVLDGNYTLRLAAGVFRSHLDDIELALSVLAETAQKLAGAAWAPASFIYSCCLSCWKLSQRMAVLATLYS